MIKRLIAFVLALVASLALAVTMAPPAAAATYGGDIGLSIGSAGYVRIWQGNGFWRNLYPGQSSYQYSGYYNDVQSFMPSSGVVCRSQYSGTSYPYKGGVRYWMSQNNLNLELYCKKA